jgi:predicted metal-dependent enzyme (double-stranded beta helix superfamily)
VLAIGLGQTEGRRNLNGIGGNPGMLSSVETFISELRTLYAEPIDDLTRFERARPALQKLLEDPELKARAETWPSRTNPDAGYYENLLFYEDPEYGFVINALIKEPGDETPIHDHGDVLTVYGVLTGGETVKRYRRVENGAGPNGEDENIELELLGDHEVSPGYIDFVPPGDIHVEHNGPDRTVGIIVRNGNVGKNLQSWYDAEAGTRKRRYGPTQVPHTLD